MRSQKTDPATTLDRPRRPMHPYLELSKARLTALVLVTTAIGFAVAPRNGFDLLLFIWTLLGTGLAAAGANSLNQWWEVSCDARMERTRRRPIPAGILTRPHAFGVAIASSVLGVSILGLLVNALTAALGAFVILFYVLVYTPLKRRTPFCTLAGAICGAIPPMMGWSGATGEIGFGAWVLAMFLFTWQIPHFLALAWLYRDDYARGGFRMLPAVDPTGRTTSGLAVVYAAILVPLTAVLFLAGMGGPVYLAGALALGAAFFLLGLRLNRTRSNLEAKRLFIASIVYLPLLLGLLVLDHGPSRSPAAATLDPRGPAVNTPRGPGEGSENADDPQSAWLDPGRRGDPDLAGLSLADRRDDPVARPRRGR